MPSSVLTEAIIIALILLIVGLLVVVPIRGIVRALRRRKAGQASTLAVVWPVINMVVIAPASVLSLRDGGGLLYPLFLFTLSAAWFYLSVQANRHAIGSAARTKQLEKRFYAAKETMGEGRLDDARREFDMLLQEAPDNPDILRALALVELESDDVEAAIRRARQAVVRDASTGPKTLLAQCLGKSTSRDDQREALELAREAFSAENGSWQASVLAGAAVKLGDQVALAVALEVLRRLTPDSFDTLFFGAFSLAAEGKTAEAHAAVARLLQTGQIKPEQAEDLHSRLDRLSTSSASQSPERADRTFLSSPGSDISK